MIIFPIRDFFIWVIKNCYSIFILWVVRLISAIPRKSAGLFEALVLR